MNAEDHESIRVQLARIEGKQDVTNERLSNVQSDISDLKLVQTNHGTRIGILEARNHLSDGERRGIATGGKALWLIIGTIPGVAAWILMHLHG